MTDAELEEARRADAAMAKKLGNRLANVYMATDGDWRDVARECLRQMRWARHSYRWASPENTIWNNGMDSTEDVTLAPDHWSETWEPE